MAIVTILVNAIKKCDSHREPSISLCFRSPEIFLSRYEQANGQIFLNREGGKAIGKKVGKESGKEGGKQVGKEGGKEGGKQGGKEGWKKVRKEGGNEGGKEGGLWNRIYILALVVQQYISKSNLQNKAVHKEKRPLGCASDIIAQTLKQSPKIKTNTYTNNLL
uniref:Uncharacterized protein n=1 Tax=Glossina brevipalpis TaxID=37001 RepID=A0A1A9W8W8_9MUSC